MIAPLTDQLPNFPVCTGAVVQIDLDVEASRNGAPGTASPPDSIVPLGIAIWALTLSANVLLTSLIAGRIWFISRDVASYGTAGVTYTRKAMNVIIESGALCFLVQFVLIVQYGLGHPSMDILVPIASQTYVRPGSKRGYLTS